MQTRWIIALVTVLGVFVATGVQADDETPRATAFKVGDKVPDFAVRTLDGKSVKLSDLQSDKKRTKNGVVVLSFWCSTCVSCRGV